jgi:hypothetical protein
MKNTDSRTTMTIRVTNDTKRRMELLKKKNPNVYWDFLLQPLIEDIRLPYESLRKINSVIAYHTP